MNDLSSIKNISRTSKLIRFDPVSRSFKKASLFAHLVGRFKATLGISSYKHQITRAFDKAISDYINHAMAKYEFSDKNAEIADRKAAVTRHIKDEAAATRDDITLGVEQAKQSMRTATADIRSDRLEENSANLKAIDDWLAAAQDRQNDIHKEKVITQTALLQDMLGNKGTENGHVNLEHYKKAVDEHVKTIERSKKTLITERRQIERLTLLRNLISFETSFDTSELSNQEERLKNFLETSIKVAYLTKTAIITLRKAAEDSNFSKGIINSLEAVLKKVGLDPKQEYSAAELKNFFRLAANKLEETLKPMEAELVSSNEEMKARLESDNSRIITSLASVDKHLRGTESLKSVMNKEQQMLQILTNTQKGLNTIKSMASRMSDMDSSIVEDFHSANQALREASANLSQLKSDLKGNMADLKEQIDRLENKSPETNQPIAREVESTLEGFGRLSDQLGTYSEDLSKGAAFLMSLFKSVVNELRVLDETLQNFRETPESEAAKERLVSLLANLSKETKGLLSEKGIAIEKISFDNSDEPALEAMGSTAKDLIISLNSSIKSATDRLDLNNVFFDESGKIIAEDSQQVKEAPPEYREAPPEYMEKPPDYADIFRDNSS